MLLLAACFILLSPLQDRPALPSIDSPAPSTEQTTPASPGNWRVTLEGGSLWTSRNDVRIPGDTGTKFSLLDLTGEGAWPVGRVSIEHDLNERHGLRLSYVPIRTNGTGTLQGPTNFDGTTFAAGAANARYTFDTYRLGYRYRFWTSDAWEWKAGASLLVRDAALEVSQGGLNARNTDLGVVPLFNVMGEWNFADRWTAIFDLEGAAAPQGRAVDATLQLGYDIDERTRVALGYRTIEGGADNDSVFTFAWIHAAVVSVRWAW